MTLTRADEIDAISLALREHGVADVEGAIADSVVEALKQANTAQANPALAAAESTEPGLDVRRLYAKIVALRDTIPHGQSARAALGEVLSLIEKDQQ